MKNRLTAFVVALLMLPPLGATLAGIEIESAAPLDGALWQPALLTLIALSLYGLLLDMLTYRRARHSLLRSQRSYLLWNAVAGAALGLLLAYLNLFTQSWLTPAGNDTHALLLGALCGMVIHPAILITRLWLAGLLKLTKRVLALPALAAETSARLLLAASLAGLLTGPIWSVSLGWLFWLAPLFLLVALQLLWHESTVFAGLPQGDWSRMLLGALSGIFTGFIGLACYRAVGGTFHSDLHAAHLTLSLALFGLLCLQLGDIVAEHWRGKTRGEVFKRKTIPISVVPKKDE